MNNASILGYTGSFLDPVTGGYPLGNGYRMYLPGLMRFNAPDRFSPFDAGGLNCYAYCAGDPINGMDPTGHMDFNEGLPGSSNAALLTRPRESAIDVEQFFDASEHPGPSTSGANLAADHANTPSLTGIRNALAAGPVKSPPEPVRRYRMPTTAGEKIEVFNAMYHNGQFNFNGSDPSEIVSIKPLIELVGEPDPEDEIEVIPELLANDDPRIVEFMKFFGLTRKSSYWDDPYKIKLPYILDRDVMTEIAFQPWWNGASWVLRPITLNPNTDYLNNTARFYYNEFGLLGSKFNLPWRWNDINQKYRMIVTSYAQFYYKSSYYYYYYLPAPG